MTPQETIARIAEASAAIGWQAGVGGMETAGSIVSYLAANPDLIDDFLAGKTMVWDWPPDWCALGKLTWHAANGRIVSPEYARQSRVISALGRSA